MGRFIRHPQSSGTNFATDGVMETRIYNASAALNLGTAASTNHSLGTGDVVVGGKLEVEGSAYFDGTLYSASTGTYLSAGMLNLVTGMPIVRLGSVSAPGTAGYFDTSWTSGTSVSADAHFRSGAQTHAGDYASGAVALYSGHTITDGNTGDVNIYSGAAGAGAADAGNITISVNGAPGTGTTAIQILGNGGGILMPNLPTADPAVAGQLWSNSGVLTVSAG